MSFVPWSSHLTPAFWSTLTHHKLHVQGLSDAPLPITATYTTGKMVKDRRTGEEIGLGAALELDAASFESGVARESATGQSTVTLQGFLRNYNTIEEFKNADKLALLKSVGDEVWNTIQNGTGEVSIESLNPFLILTFADLKKYRYYYWCGFPALLQKPGWDLVGEWSKIESEQEVALQSHSTGCSLMRLLTPEVYEYAPIADYESFFESVPESQQSLVFVDASTHSQSPAWPLRNVLTYLSTRHAVSTIRVVRRREQGDSLVGILQRQSTSEESMIMPSVVGWEKNDKGKLGARMADLAPLMDPAQLADQAVDLNLQLMRWRIMPELNLDKVKQTKVLLLGAGTLGCYVARTLMAWGVRKITLVDSSTVSFSNPVRQPLFEFVDSLDGGKPKAEAAAAALKRVYPGVDATGVQLSIPMPGHPISQHLIEQTQDSVQQLEDLIDQHDVVYLLMDSRESRWLPTVIAASKRKLVMNVALGFDTYLIMRHGVPAPTSEAISEPAVIQPGQPFTGRLGCYYCNDIVAPMDSLTDRTLDQMCTVTRPGIAAIASATAVELMVSVLQHPLGIYAPSDVPLVSSSAQNAHPPALQPKSPLGIVPHQIRGYLSEFNALKITGQSYDKCTGCSTTIIEAYQTSGMAMLLETFNDAKYLERLTGLDKLAEESEAAMEGVDWDEEDEEDEEGDI